MVLPYIASRASKSTRGLRGWMMAAPVDVAALLTPLLLTDKFWKGTIFEAGLAVVILGLGGLYSGRRHMSILDELPTLCGRLLASAAIVAMIAALRHEEVEHVAAFMRGVALSSVLVLLGRAVTRSAVVLARKRRWVEHNALVIGTGPIAVDLARVLRRYPAYGLRFVGHVDDPPATDTGARPPVVDTIANLRRAIELTESDVVIIADHQYPEAALMETIRAAGDAGAHCDIWVVPRLWGSRSGSRLPDHIGAIPVVHIRDSALSGPRWILKRLTDIVLSSLLLLILSPILLVVALLTLLDGGPGILFHQERIGRDGKPFQVIKFRSMRPVNEAESQTNWSIAHDKRVSVFGRLIRRTSIDELPQLWNILRGDMTIVGPRPERPYFVEKFAAEYPGYAMRHRVPVGLTGLAQVSGLRGDTPISDRARFDNFYIENWSLWLDVKVVLRTIAEVFRGGGR
ncbi:exopolysaccharide biosynthesis polyprenyl glycosylphosphotransferase [Longispora fulva]|uniref:Exopolysaccharide biosynthesis polyprenyl glycosylphosphotransferase n=2 Tax=Longispora fulva TaxID=619741 RepID=A0A8J7GUQ5_9ACTN|nr:sugar transferase [Longispora fulva]MBG6137746.1 exopolysaccharide biosynthesis polyprenyl glycosylphosphotransferase [Longispora fulva]